MGQYESKSFEIQQAQMKKKQFSDLLYQSDGDLIERSGVIFYLFTKKWRCSNPKTVSEQKVLKIKKSHKKND